MTVLAEAYDVALLDLDGVIYVGADAVPQAPEALAASRDLGMRLAFVTNNAARPPSVVADHLTSLGVAAATDEVVTSAQAAARLLAEDLPAGAPVLVVGGEGLVAALTELGLRPVWSVEDEPVAVVQGFHPEVGWRQLAEGALALDLGVTWVASNTDTTIPTPRGRAPGNGTLVNVLRTVTGREPIVAGKPEPPMHREAMLRSGASTPLVVGDRLDTDIEGATRSGVDSLLVFTGVTDPEHVIGAAPQHRPTYVAEDLRALLATAEDARVTPGVTQVGAWVARVIDGRIELSEAGSSAGADRRVDAVRALCGAVWGADTVPAGIAEALVKAGW
jgi:glycerol-1-phosphatase